MHFTIVQILLHKLDNILIQNQNNISFCNTQITEMTLYIGSIHVKLFHSVRNFFLSECYYIITELLDMLFLCIIQVSIHLEIKSYALVCKYRYLNYVLCNVTR